MKRYMALVVASGFVVSAVVVSALAGFGALPAAAGEEGVIRIATFNASLNRREAGGLIASLRGGGDAQARRVAEIIQRVDPDVLLINEFDFDAGGEALALFRDRYLAVSQNGAPPIAMPFAFLAPSNTGVPTGFDLDRDGSTGGPGDAQGFGFFEGQFAMVVLSKLPIAEAESRTFQRFLWRDMPGARLPDDAPTAAPADWYDAGALAVLRLSSKSHWDVVIDVGDDALHLLASHPTPPVFDGPEDRNGRRNADEVRFWADYIAGADYMVDDAGRRGGLAEGAAFVIAGDLNLDPADGDGIRAAGRALLEHPLIQDPRPMSIAGAAAAAAQGGANAGQTGDPALDTADFGDDPPFGPGNLRADYVLPSAGLEILGAGVFWPEADGPLAYLVGSDGRAASDHRLVWVDLRLP